MNVTRCLLAQTRFALAMICGTWLVAVLTVVSGGSTGWSACAVGIVLGLAATRDRRVSLAANLANGALSLAILAVAIALSVIWPDASWDAQLYRFPAVFALADGWNPLLDRASPIAAELTPPNIDMYVRAYPKALWFVAASLYDACGNVDAGKAINWLMLLAPVGPAAVLFRSVFRCRWPWFAAIAAAANPVAIYQLTTGYVDGVLAGLFTLLLCTLLIASKTRGRGWAALAAASAALLIQVKFTGLVYVAVTVMIVAVLIGMRKGIRPALRHVAFYGAVLCCSVIVGWGSYVQNCIEHGNPFYSAWSPDGSNSIDWQTSPEFKAHGRIEKYVRSIGATSIPGDEEGTADPIPRVPFTALGWNDRYDPRFAGFGPLFWEALLLSLLVGFRRRPAFVWAAIVAVLASTFATDAAWWARLAPQSWLIPVLIVSGDQDRTSRLLARACTFAVFSLLVVNSVVVARSSIRRATRESRDWYTTITIARPVGWVAGAAEAERSQRAVRRRIEDATRINGLRSVEWIEAPSEALPVPDWGERLRLGIGLGERGD